VKSNRIVRRGRITTSWSEAHQQARLTYRNRDFSREVLITAKPTGAKSVYANGRISFDISLGPAETWHCCVLYELFDGQTKHSIGGTRKRERRAQCLWNASVTNGYAIAAMVAGTDPG
jgi:hypothetical protein